MKHSVRNTVGNPCAHKLRTKNADTMTKYTYLYIAMCSCDDVNIFSILIAFQNHGIISLCQQKHQVFGLSLIRKWKMLTFFMKVHCIFQLFAYFKGGMVTLDISPLFLKFACNISHVYMGVVTYWYKWTKNLPVVWTTPWQQFYHISPLPSRDAILLESPHRSPFEYFLQ